MVSKKAITEELLRDVKPAYRTDQVRNIWPELETLRAARLTEKQICGLLPKYGLDPIPYKAFLSVCYRIRHGKESLTPAPATDIVAPKGEAAAILERAKQRLSDPSEKSIFKRG